MRRAARVLLILAVVCTAICTSNRASAEASNVASAASSWQALRPGLPITVYGDIVFDGVRNAINIRIR